MAIKERTTDAKILTDKCYLNGNRFYGVYKALQNSNPILPSIPTFTNCAFACEMYLKSLLFLEGKSCGKVRSLSHNLWNLFNCLSTDSKDKLYNILGGETPEYIREQIHLFAEHFEDSRYCYESELPLDFYATIFGFADALKALREESPCPQLTGDMIIKDVLKAFKVTVQ